MRMKIVSDLTDREFSDILVAALKEYRSLNAMDAHLFTHLEMTQYKGAVDRVEKVDAAMKDIERARFMIRSFLCPYCHGPLKAVLLKKARSK